MPFIRVKKWRLWTVLKKQNINALATKDITLTFTRFSPTAKIDQKQMDNIFKEFSTRKMISSKWKFNPIAFQ